MLDACAHQQIVTSKFSGDEDGKTRYSAEVGIGCI